MDAAPPDKNADSARKKRISTGRSKVFEILLGILLVLLFVVVILYLIDILRTIDRVGPLESRLAALERKIGGIEKQLAEVRAGSRTPGIDPDLVKRMDALIERVETLEKRKRLPAESKIKQKTVTSPKQSAGDEKQFHTIQKGETFFQISKKYGISMESLEELNNLSREEPLRAGQRLLVSPQRQPDPAP